MKRRNFGALALLLWTTTSACGDPMKFAQELEEERSLGVRVTNAAGEATVAAGDSGQIELLFGGPEGSEPLTVAYQLCPAADSARGVPFCVDDPWIEGDVDFDGAPIDFTVPESDEGDTRLALLAVACASGQPELADDPLDWSCSDGSDPIRLSFDAWTRGDEHKDLNPDLSEAFIAVDDERLVLEAPTDPATCDEGVLHVAAEKTHEFLFVLGEDAREQVEFEGEEKELLQLSTFATAGLFDRQFTILEAEEEPRTRVEWEAPDKSGPVKIFLVVRDGRGGVTWITTSVCVE